MLELRLTTIGNSTGFVLPKEALSRLNAKKGDTLYLVEGQYGYTLTGHNPAFAAQMRIAEEGMADYRNALRELAK